MRINLKVPFAQKDVAKELGARWDGVRKIWYVVDPECLEVFSDWMPVAEGATTAVAVPSLTTVAPAANVAKATNSANGSAAARKGVFTGPAACKPACLCKVPAWEHCEHTQAV